MHEPFSPLPVQPDDFRRFSGLKSTHFKTFSTLLNAISTNEIDLWRVFLKRNL